MSLNGEFTTAGSFFETRSFRRSLSFIQTMSAWDTGLCSCCAEPGGVALCCRAFCCSCNVVGDINKHAGGPCGEGSRLACLASFCGCTPCVMFGAAPLVAQLKGSEESGINAFCFSCLCPCCYILQVRRQCEINLKDNKGNPMQMEMS